MRHLAGRTDLINRLSHVSKNFILGNSCTGGADVADRFGETLWNQVRTPL